MAISQSRADVGWADIVSPLNETDRGITRAAEQHVANSARQSQSSRNRRGIFLAALQEIFGGGLPLGDIQHTLRVLLDKNPEASTIHKCTDAALALKKRGFTEIARARDICLNRGHLRILLNPIKALSNGGNRVVIYASNRQSVRRNSDVMRGLLHLFKQATANHPLMGAELLLCDLYNDHPYTSNDFFADEPWLVQRLERVIESFDIAYSQCENRSGPRQKGSGRRGAVATEKRGHTANQLELALT